MARRIFMMFGVSLMAGSAMVFAARPAAAGQTEGTCQAQASIVTSDGGTIMVDSRTTKDEVLSVPRSGTVSWAGSLDGPPGDFDGSVKLVMPAPFEPVTLATWSGNSAISSGNGTKAYTIPDAVPAGAEFQIIAEHRDANGLCAGYVNARIDGDLFSSPISVGIVAGTVLSAAGVALVTAPLWKAL